MNSIANQKINLVFTNVLGARLIEQSWQVSKGQSQIKISTEGLEDGIYMLYFTGEDGQLIRTYRLIHQTK